MIRRLAPLLTAAVALPVARHTGATVPIRKSLWRLPRCNLGCGYCPYAGKVISLVDAAQGGALRSSEGHDMPALSERVRDNIRAQGFCGLPDETYAQINYPLRLAPAICMVWAAVGTALESYVILWALAPFAALGAIFPSHPFDVFYNHGLRHLFRTPALPRYGFRRRFACALATVMLVAAAWAFQAGAPVVGAVLGWALVAAAFVNVSTGFCIPSFLVRMLAGKVRCTDIAAGEAT